MATEKFILDEKPIKPHKNSKWIDTATLILLALFFAYFLAASLIWLNNLGGSSKSKEVEIESVNYESMLDQLLKGEDFRIQCNLDKMKLDPVPPPGQVRAHSRQVSFNLGYFQNFGRLSVGNPKAYVVTSYSIYLVHPVLATIYEYGKLRMYEDETYEVVIDYIKASDFTVLQSERFTGKLGKGDEGLKVFKYSPKFRKYF